MPDIFVRIQHGVRSDGRGNYRYRPATSDDLLAALCERGWRLRLTDDHDTYQAPSANDPNGPTCPRCFDDRWAPQPEADAYDCVHCGFGISGNEFANGLDANEYVANGTVPMDDRSPTTTWRALRSPSRWRRRTTHQRCPSGSAWSPPPSGFRSS
jgi:hypothetical protein